MVLVSKDTEVAIYYRETTEQKRSCRFCIKPVVTVQPRADKRSDAVNVQVVRGKTTTFIHLDEEEAKKVQHHGDVVIKKLQKIHKSIIWNFFVGRSFVDKIPKGKQGNEEININVDENSDFDPDNPKTWSEESLDFIGSLLKATEFQYDGFVILFCVANDPDDGSVDYDELAWELEKCLTYHYVATKSQLVMNEEGTMSRKGLDPVSRKTKTPGKRKSGYCVYLAYQLIDSICHDQVVGEAINRCVDIGAKKKQLLTGLSEARLLPQADERIRAQVKEMKEFMSRDQLSLVYRVRDVKEQENLDMLSQFLTLIKGSGKSKGAAGMMGLPQFLSFLNKSNDIVDSGGGGGSGAASSGPRPTSSRASNITSPRNQTKGSIPRPTSSSRMSNSGGGARKASITTSLSSRSPPPDQSRSNGRKKEELASIPDSGSSSPDTLRKEDHKASQPQKRGATAKARTAASAGTTRGKAGEGTKSRSSAAASAAQQQRSRNSPAGSRSGTPRGGVSGGGGLGSTRSSVNGDQSPRSHSRASSAANSPRLSSAASSRRGSRPAPPPGTKMITREDLRRMNKSYPSGGKSASSFSRSAIPMS